MLEDSNAEYLMDKKSIIKLDMSNGILKDTNEWQTYYGTSGKIAFQIDEPLVRLKSIEYADFMSLVLEKEQLSFEMVDFLIKLICINYPSVFVCPMKKVETFLKVNGRKQSGFYKEETTLDEHNKIFSTDTVVMPIIKINPGINHFILVIICNDRKNIIFFDSLLKRSKRKANNADGKRFQKIYLDKRRQYREENKLNVEKDGSWNLILPDSYRPQAENDSSSCGVLIVEYLRLFLLDKAPFYEKKPPTEDEPYNDKEISQLRNKFGKMVRYHAKILKDYCCSCNYYIPNDTEKETCEMCNKTFHNSCTNNLSIRVRLGLEEHLLCQLCLNYLQKKIND